MSLQQKITEARKTKGFTQEELADRAGVTIRTIQRIESGDTIPRNYTLKAIAEALDLSFEKLVATNGDTVSTANKTDTEADIHFLKILNLSCFTYLVIPYVHFLIPSWLLKRRKDTNPAVRTIARKIITQQIYWLIALHLAFFIVLAINFALAASDSNPINYLWPLFIMYFLNAILILITQFRITHSYTTNVGQMT
jgi:transcriptional regulator with XRE-family HTH domain